MATFLKFEETKSKIYVTHGNLDQLLPSVGKFVRQHWLNHQVKKLSKNGICE
jgi:hypothetical protein